MVTGVKAYAAPAGEKETKFIDFNVEEQRWDTSTFWDPDDLLIDKSKTPPTLKIPAGDISDAYSAIWTDLARRDCRLVRQADRLVAWNPVFRKDFTQPPNHQEDFNKGQCKEIRVAQHHDIPMVIYQDPKHDPQKYLETFLGLQRGSLGWSYEKDYIRIYGDEEEFFKAVFE